ncbi:MAG TPA: MAPEG family protein [Acetobacteraceae bacterium]|nr:MAPEG family protein [Acetobacteraceae bacterium]
MAAILAWWLLAAVLAPVSLAGVAPHVALALAALLPSAALLAVMILAQMGARAMTGAIDPLAGTDSPFLRTNQRVIANTVEQMTVFVPALLALAAGVPAARMGPVVALAYVFAVARLVFWIGYLAGVRLRAPGMAATFAVNVATLAAAAWVWLT